MMNRNAEDSKKKAQEMLESIGTDTPFEQKAIRMIYGFVRSLHEECKAVEGGAVL